MNYAGIIKVDTANGLGCRVTLFVSGCDHHCKGCQNPQTWDCNYGKEFNVLTIDKILEYMNHDYIKGLSLSGGDPLKKENIPYILWLLREVKRVYPNKDVWCWTGDTWEQLMARPDTKAILQYIDVLVDGEFIESQKSLSLVWKGSMNQRVLDVKKSLELNHPVLYSNI